MIDLKTLEAELRQARLARIDAQAAGCDDKELLWHMEHSHRAWQRLTLAVDGFDPDLLLPS